VAYETTSIIVLLIRNWSDAATYALGRRCMCAHQVATLFYPNDVIAAILNA